MKIYLDKDSGISTRQGRLILRSNNFSTHDADHDNCGCNCAVIMSGGWWFDSCGPSNLNGVYYSADQYKQKINGIRWDHSSSSNISGPTIFSLRTSRMMMRPLHS
nr:angiopoietin-4-like [Cavia porcellus]